MFGFEVELTLALFRHPHRFGNRLGQIGEERLHLLGRFEIEFVRRSRFPFWIGRLIFRVARGIPLPNFARLPRLDIQQDLMRAPIIPLDIVDLIRRHERNSQML